MACANAMFGEADPVPAESRRTHLLGNMQKTLLRAAVFNIGLDAFEVADTGEDDGQVDIDADAFGGFGERARRVRSRRTIEYYGDRTNIWQLAVFVALLKAYDSLLLYPMLSDMGGQQELNKRCKMDLMLDSESSLVAECAGQLPGMLTSWQVGEATRKPWCTLAFLGAPAHEEGFMRWARNEILRLASSVFRRFETKYSSWPYALYPLCTVGSTDAERRLTAQALLQADAEELDSYSDGIRRLFASEEALLSSACRATLRGDFTAHGMSTALIERLHSEITHNIPKRAPARNFHNMARESVLKQAAALHVNRGGQHPLGARKGCPAGATESVETPAILQGLVATSTSNSDQQPSSLVAPPHHGASHQPRSSASAEAAAECEIGHAIVPDAADFAKTVVVDRPLVDALAPRSEQAAGAAIRKGLSPFLLERNKHVQAARQSKGSPLTAGELRIVHEEFKEFWNSLADHSVYVEAYRDWLLSKPKADDGPVNTYRTSWGGGCSVAPITSDEFFRCQQEFGWPTDSEVFDPMSGQAPTPATRRVASLNYASIDLWSIGARPHNVYHKRMPSEMQHEVIGRGLNNCLLKMSKDIVDTSDVMLLIAGANLRDANETHRICVLVTGMCYSPRVFEVARCHFQLPEHEKQAELSLPSRCRIRSRACRIGHQVDCIDFQTSDELVLELAESFRTMRLWQATYNVPDPDKTLLWCDITKLEELGCLWEPGMKVPLGAGNKRNQSADAMLRRMRQTDPLNSTSRPSARRTGGRCSGSKEASQRGA